MENNGKSLILQRTLGAAVLVAAAATLVPLVLDGEGIKSSREQVKIPDEPTFELQLDENEQPKVRMLQAKGAIDRAEQDSVAAVEGVEEAVVAPADVISSATLPAGQAVETPEQPTEPETPMASLPEETDALAQALPKEPPAAGSQSMEDVIQKLSQPAAPAKAPVPATTQPSALGGDVADSWTIQMGAFKDRANAEKTVGALVAKGWAYLGTQTPGVYRVFVGPEIRRERADQLRDRVASDTGTKGVVVRYVP